MIAIIVPVRRASTRLADKPLYPIAGTPLILHVALRLRQIAGDFPLYFAVDDHTVRQLLEQSGFSVIMTDPGLPSGTDRIAAANRQIGASHVINIQGDEPQVGRVHITLLADALQRGSSMATLALTEFTAQEFNNPNRPKVVVGANSQALYFSRAAIPFDRTAGAGVLSSTSANLARTRIGLHQGFYGYSGAFLQQFTQLPPTPLEEIEKLEQLRALEHGYPITVRFNNYPTQGIDTPEDVARYQAILAASPSDTVQSI